MWHASVAKHIVFEKLNGDKILNKCKAHNEKRVGDFRLSNIFFNVNVVTLWC